MGEREKLQDDLDEVTATLSESENASKEEIHRLQNEKSKVETELSSVRDKVAIEGFNVRSTGYSTGTILDSDTAPPYTINSGVTTAGTYSVGNAFLPCVKCGENYWKNSLVTTKCPNCGTEQ